MVFIILSKLIIAVFTFMYFIIVFNVIKILILYIILHKC